MPVSACPSCGSHTPPQYEPAIFDVCCPECGHVPNSVRGATGAAFIPYEAPDDRMAALGASGVVFDGERRIRAGPLRTSRRGAATMRALPGQTGILDAEDQRAIAETHNLPDVHDCIEGTLRKMNHRAAKLAERAKTLFNQARIVGLQRRADVLQLQARYEGKLHHSAAQRRNLRETKWGGESLAMAAVCVWVTLNREGHLYDLNQIAVSVVIKVVVWLRPSSTDASALAQHVSTQPLRQVQFQYRHLKRLFKGTPVLDGIRSVTGPSDFIAEYVLFLETQRSHKVIEKALQAFLAQLDDAGPSSSKAKAASKNAADLEAGMTSAKWFKAFKLALSLCNLSIPSLYMSAARQAALEARGVTQEDIGAGEKHDPRLRAFALVIAALEGTTKAVAPEVQLLRCFRAAEEWRLARMAAQADEEDEQEEAESTSTTIAAKNDTIGHRYRDLISMVAPWATEVPWIKLSANNEEEGTKAVRRNRNVPSGVGSGGRGRVKKFATTKQDDEGEDAAGSSASSESFTRREFAMYLADIVLFRDSLAKKVETKRLEQQLEDNDEEEQGGEDEEEMDRYSDGRMLAAEELASLHASVAQLDAFDDDTSGDGGLLEQLQTQSEAALRSGSKAVASSSTSTGKATSSLLERLPHSVLQPGVLEELSDDTVDTLLFDEGELQGYMRSETEMQQLLQFKEAEGMWQERTPSASAAPAKRSQTAARQGATSKKQRREQQAMQQEAEEGVEIIGTIDG